jgi:CHRD domain
LSPSNEVGTVIGSTGSGNEILSGITFDSTTRVLSLAIGYGSAAGFADLSGPVTALHIHGPAGTRTNAAILINLASLHLPAADPARGGIIFGGVTLTEAQTNDLLAGLNYVNLHTLTNGGGEIRGQLIPVRNHAPTVACPEATTLECDSPEGAHATVSVNVGDEDGDELTVVWSVNGTAIQTNAVPAGTPPTATNMTLAAVFPLGISEVSVAVSDGGSVAATCNTTITVQDTKPPEVESITPRPHVLWPPNHRMVPIHVAVKATDVCGEVKSKIISVASNEPVNGIGDGNTSPDWLITGDLTVELRAERSGHGNGRIYTIKLDIEDEVGNKVTRETTVKVPHDMGKRREQNGRVVPVQSSLTPTRYELIKRLGAQRAAREVRSGHTSNKTD